MLVLDDLGVDTDGLNLLQVRLVHVLSDHLDERVVALELHVADAHLVHLVDDTCVVGCEHLRAVLPVSLVAIVLTRVVAGRQVDTALRLEVSDGERALRRGAHLVEEVDLDAVGREDIGHRAGVEVGVVAAVVTDDGADLLAVLEALLQIVGESLRRHADGIDVHAVGARAHDAAQSARSKFQVAVERLNQFRLVGIVEHGLNGMARILVEVGSEPLLCFRLALGDQFFVVVHNNRVL